MIHWSFCLLDELKIVRNMARYDEDIEKEIRRIQGQLLVAKQICRENVFINFLFYNRFE